MLKRNQQKPLELTRGFADDDELQIHLIQADFYQSENRLLRSIEKLIETS